MILVKMLRFYPQYKIEDFENMDVRNFRVLYNGMIRLHAEEVLYSMEAISYPHVQDKQRNKIHRRYYKIAYPENFENKALKTSEIELI